MILVDEIMETVRALDEQARGHVLSYARFLFNEDMMDIKMYDEAKANDDGYRVSLEELEKKYGLYPSSAK